MFFQLVDSLSDKSSEVVRKFHYYANDNSSYNGQEEENYAMSDE